uniref:Uncharacterized protein n=1 Tax=Oryza brachyantha TaxID=4533 RepID=J3M5Z9_ORYBR
MPAAPSPGRLFRFLPPHSRPQGTDIAAAAGWTVAGVSTAIWLVQLVDLAEAICVKQKSMEFQLIRGADVTVCTLDVFVIMDSWDATGLNLFLVASKEHKFQAAVEPAKKFRGGQLW